MAYTNPIPVPNNSKKISQLRGRDTITYHQDHSWLALAQYNDQIAAYHNIAINLSAITGYSINESQHLTSYAIADTVSYLVSAYNLEELRDFAYTWELNGDFSYSQIGQALASYIQSYTVNSLMWQHFPSHEETMMETKYMYAENGMYVLTDKGKKIIVT